MIYFYIIRIKLYVFLSTSQLRARESVKRKYKCPLVKTQSSVLIDLYFPAPHVGLLLLLICPSRGKMRSVGESFARCRVLTSHRNRIHLQVLVKQKLWGSRFMYACTATAGVARAAALISINSWVPALPVLIFFGGDGGGGGGFKATLEE